MLVGSLGVLITISALRIASPKITSGNFLVSLSLLVLHVAACIGYYLYSQGNVGDATGYYLDPYNRSKEAFAFSTIFTYKTVYFLKHVLGGSFFECFLLFQGFGFWGVMILARTFAEISLKTRTPSPPLATIFLFLPSLHLWTSAIGKDAPVFFGIALLTWSAIELRQRILWICLAVLVMLLFRPYIALIAVTSLAAAALLHREIRLTLKIPLVIAAALGATLLIGAVQVTFGVNVMDMGSLTTFIGERNEIAGMGIGNTSVGNAPILTRLVSLLFRPFFFDTSSFLGIIASFENIGSVLLFLYLLKNWMAVRYLAKQVYFIQFCIIYSVGVLVVLTAVYYNVGLGLRARVMAFPTLLSIVVATLALKRRELDHIPTGGEAAVATRITNTTVGGVMQ